MTNIAIFTPVPSFRLEAIADGYVYECSCGELFNCIGVALSCRKCRNYCVFGYCTHVVDIVNNEIVAGTAPTHEEYEEACVRAEARWEEEKAQLEFQGQMWRQEGELYEIEMARRTEEEAIAFAEMAEDSAYAIQDELMGY